MTGGTTGGIEARSNKWDDKKIEGLFSIFHCILNVLFVLTLLMCLGLKIVNSNVQRVFQF